MAAIGLTIVVAVHLAAVYVAMMGPLVCLWLQWRAARDDLSAQLDRFFLRLSVIAMLAAVALGGAALLLIDRLFPDAYLAAARVLPERRYWYGGIEIVFSLVCFVLALGLSDKGTRSRFWTRWLATLSGGANLVYHFPPLFVMLGVLSVRPEDWGRKLKFTSLLTDPEIAARTAHHLFAALLLTGMVAVWYGLRHGGDGARAVVWGARLAVAGVVFQFLSGLWLMTVMPAETRAMLLGESILAALLFAAALLLTFFVLPRLAAMALGHIERRHALVSALLVLAVLFLMTVTRHRTRAILLEQRRASAQIMAVGPANR